MWLRLLVVLILSLSALQAAMNTNQASFPMQSTGSVLFSDNFESYQATATCNSINDGCDAPPHTGGPTNLPAYWVPASSDTCSKRGGCTQWDGNAHMGPNSVFAVVTEAPCAESGDGATQCMKLGASDWYADKTSMAVWLSPSDFPSGQLVSFTFKVWLSAGIDNPACYCNAYGSGPNNALTIQLPVGKMRYQGQIGNQSGVWEMQTTPISTGGHLQPNGNYHLTTQTWHTITITFDMTNSVWSALVIDGEQPFANVNGYPTYDSPAEVHVNYDDFAIFIVPYADYQSITSAPSHGFQPFYAYVDDVEVSLGSVNSTVQQPTQTSSITTQTNSTTTTSTPIPEFGVSTSVILVTVLIIAAFHVNGSRKYRKASRTNSILH